MGHFLSFVALKRHAENSGFPTIKLGQQICHHIIGMVPEKLGEPPVSIEAEETNSYSAKEDEHMDIDDEDNDESSSEVFIFQKKLYIF